MADGKRSLHHFNITPGGGVWFSSLFCCVFGGASVAWGGFKENGFLSYFLLALGIILFVFGLYILLNATTGIDLLEDDTLEFHTLSGSRFLKPPDIQMVRAEEINFYDGISSPKAWQILIHHSRGKKRLHRFKGDEELFRTLATRHRNIDVSRLDLPPWSPTLR